MKSLALTVVLLTATLANAQPPGLPANITATISLAPGSAPEVAPTFAGTTVVCSWNGSYWRGVGAGGTLLVDIVNDEGGLGFSYTGFACAQALSIPYAICNGSALKSTLPATIGSFKNPSYICGKPNPYAVRYQASITP